MLHEEWKFGKSPLLCITIRLQPEKVRKNNKLVTYWV